MSKGRVIYTEHLVDVNSGELISSKSVYVSKNDERFWMFRVTDNPSWVFDLGGSEFKLLVRLCYQGCWVLWFMGIICVVYLRIVSWLILIIFIVVRFVICGKRWIFI